MFAFFEYVRNITYYLVLMAFVGILAPSGNYKKYIALVMGIMLIGVVVGPLQRGTQMIPATDLFAQIMPVPTIAEGDITGMAEWQYAQVKSVFHEQLSIQTETLLARNGFVLISAEWETSEDFSQIEGVRLIVQEKTTAPTPRPFIRVEPVRIAPYSPATEQDYGLPIKKLISDFYGISIDNIHVKAVYY